MKIWDKFAVFRYKQSKSGYLIDVVPCTTGLRDSTHSYVLEAENNYFKRNLKYNIFLTTC